MEGQDLLAVLLLLLLLVVLGDPVVQEDPEDQVAQVARSLLLVLAGLEALHRPSVPAVQVVHPQGLGVLEVRGDQEDLRVPAVLAVPQAPADLFLLSYPQILSVQVALRDLQVLLALGVRFSNYSDSVLQSSIFDSEEKHAPRAIFLLNGDD
ncbi:hypothetical protein B0H11DRAFT_2244208 [Mycena galericulata]|nr:hypothetical protein B0H11DRAFT_2244208 [Mycena galericulata]